MNGHHRKSHKNVNNSSVTRMQLLEAQGETPLIVIGARDTNVPSLEEELRNEQHMRDF